MSNKKQYTRHSVHGAPSGERRVGNVGPMIIQAAKQGSKDNLEFLLNLPEGTLAMLQMASYTVP